MHVFWGFCLCPIRVKYIIADQLAVEARQEDESEFEGGAGRSYTGGGNSEDGSQSEAGTAAAGKGDGAAAPEVEESKGVA